MGTVPARDADWLLTEKYGGDACLAYQHDLDRLKEGEPLDYVIGWTPFLDCTIHLDSRPLIPRTETEFWVESALRVWRDRVSERGAIRVLDLFAGSGCIGVAVLRHLPHAVVDFAEIDAQHLPTIARNCEENHIDPTRKYIYESDVYSGLPETRRYDLILANPPYISAASHGAVAESVLTYEPHQALFASDNGLELIARSLRGAQTYLRGSGEIWIEHGADQGPAVRELASTLGFSADTLCDQYERERVLIGRLSSE